MANLGLNIYPLGEQHAYPLGTFARPVLTFSDHPPKDLTTGIYATVAPLNGAGTALGVSISGTRVFEVGNFGVTVVPAGLSVGGVAYTWPSAGPTGSSSFLTSDADNVVSWTTAATTETIDGRTLQYFTDPHVRRLLEEILLTLSENGVD